MICLAAAGLLTWMILWMRRHSRFLKREPERQVEAALGRSALALAALAFLAVAREGLETALWLTVNGEAGKFLAGIFGWDAPPALEQVLAYLLFLVPVLIAFLWGRSRPPRHRPAEGPAPSGAAAG